MKQISTFNQIVNEVLNEINEAKQKRMKVRKVKREYTPSSLVVKKLVRYSQSLDVLHSKSIGPLFSIVN